MDKNKVKLDKEFYARLLDSLEGYAVFTMDKAGLVTSWNKGAERLLGYKDDEIIGKNASTILLPDERKDGEQVKELNAVSHQGNIKSERWYLNKMGYTLLSSDTIYPLRDRRGAISGYVKVMRDVSDFRRSENNLLFLSEASKLLSSSLNYTKTLNRVAEIAVPQIADWCTVDLLVGKGKIEQVAVAHKDPKKVTWAKELRKKQPIDMKTNSGVPHVLRTGKSEFYPLVTDKMLAASVKTKKTLDLVRSLQITSVILVPLLVGGMAIGVITFLTTGGRKRFTKTDLRMAEELATRASLVINNAQLYKSARENEFKFKSFVRSNIIGVFIANKEGKIYAANESFSKIIGYSREELKQGKVIRWKLVPREYETREKKAMKELEQKGSTTPWEKEYIRSDGSQIPVLVTSTLIEPSSGTNITLVVDMTERKKLEQRKDEFIGIASHELKTPLTSIKGYIQILERIIREMGNERAKTLISKTNTYINRMNSLISDLLDVSKIQSGKIRFNYEKFDFYDLVTEVIDAIQPTTTKHTIICKDCIHQDIIGDRNRLEQVFTNLLSNAIKYSPKADKVTIRMTRDSKYITVGVTDYGIGIEKRHHDKLFRRFYRIEKSSNQFSGLGIGLYISSEIVNRHGGKIWVESMEGKGSTFYFKLPLKNK